MYDFPRQRAGGHRRTRRPRRHGRGQALGCARTLLPAGAWFCVLPTLLLFISGCMTFFGGVVITAADTHGNGDGGGEGRRAETWIVRKWIGDCYNYTRCLESREISPEGDDIYNDFMQEMTGSCTYFVWCFGERWLDDGDEL